MGVGSSPPDSPAPGTIRADGGGNLDSVKVLSPPSGLYLESLLASAPFPWGLDVGLPNAVLTSLRLLKRKSVDVTSWQHFWVPLSF